ncbi:MAG: tRNA pseudouridine(38-40) synthase TruA [Ignavibacteria bacterium]|nr:tRNA pseudouridine(38-40) synthase TruA [Ignavibacteria bacterium]
MHNYKMIIQYDGSAYHGWQIQQNAESIQEHITKAVQTLVKHPVNVIGAGRTDTGVHALGQVANFRTDSVLELHRFTHSLNGILPAGISIIHCEEVPEAFHARFDACARTYRYFIYHQKNPFLRNHAYFYPVKPNIGVLQQFCSVFPGEHNFSGFCKTIPEIGTTICTIDSISWHSSGGILVFQVKADRFLHGMVRLLVGTMLHAQRHGFELSWLDQFLSGGVKTPFAVPPEGLYLFRVDY